MLMVWKRFIDIPYLTFSHGTSDDSWGGGVEAEGRRVSGVTVDAEMKVPSPENTEVSNVLICKPGIGQNKLPVVPKRPSRSGDR